MSKNMLYRRVLRVGETRCWLDQKNKKARDAIRKVDEALRQAWKDLQPGQDFLKDIRDVAKSAYVAGKVFSVPIGGLGGCEGWHWHPIELNQATEQRPGLDFFNKDNTVRFETAVEKTWVEYAKLVKKLPKDSPLPRSKEDFLALFEFSYEYLPWPDGCEDPKDVDDKREVVTAADVERSREYVRQHGKEQLGDVKDERTTEERAQDLKALS